jgi:hypothetical protein
MDNRANHQEKHPNCATTAIWLCEDREYLAAYICNSCYPETSVGEVVSPKSTLKHLFGTGKDNQVSLQREVLFKYIDLTGVGCRRNYRDVRISAVDRFVDSTLRYGSRLNDIDNKS